MEPVSNCTLNDDLLLAPLPARKQLWEASNEYSWGLEGRRDAGVSTVFGLKANGQMVKLTDYHVYPGGVMTMMKADQSADSSSNWQEWCSGMDGLGSLVMLAATLSGS